MRISFFPALLAVSLLASAVAGAPKGHRLGLPAHLSRYRMWQQILKVPFEVPLALYTRCVAPTERDWEMAKTRYGPHTRRFIRVYGNDDAVRAVRTGRKPFPVGAILAKEKFAGTPHGDADGVAFMIKRDGSAFAASGGWEFLYYPPSSDSRRTHQHCLACHQAVKKTDYVFSRYPR